MIKKYNDVIILSIIWIVSIYSVISVILYSYEIGIQNYIGYGLLIGISLLRFFRIKRFKTILGILLVIGSINAIQFTYSTMTFFFNLNCAAFDDKTFSFGIQPLSLILLIFLLIANRSNLMNLLVELFSEDPNIVAQRQQRIAEKHYNELKAEKDSKLKDILDNKNMYRTEYVKAAQRLIDERMHK